MSSPDVCPLRKNAGVISDARREDGLVFQWDVAWD